MDKTKSIAETLGQSQRVFKGVRFDVRAVELPVKDGRTVRREFVAHPGAVVILPVIDAKRIVMIRNQRFAVHEELWELPAGTLEPDEPPDHTAGRELIEETGYQAGRVEKLLEFYTTPGICNEIMYAYLARDLKEVGQQLEETEKIKVEVVEWDRVINMMKDGVICDGKTLTTLLYYNKFINFNNK